MRRLSVAGLLVLALLLLPASAIAATVEADASDYPMVRAIYVTDSPTYTPPTVTENGQSVTGLVATNLGSAKSIVLAVDRSRSMNGKPLADAVGGRAGLRGGQAARGPRRGRHLRHRAGAPHGLPDLDERRRLGAALDLHRSRSPAPSCTTPSSCRRTRWPARPTSAASSSSSPTGTRPRARRASATPSPRRSAPATAIYVVGIESADFNPAPLQRLAKETGGNYYPAASSDALAEVYSTIASELARTWRHRVRDDHAAEREDQPRRQVRRARTRP